MKARENDGVWLVSLLPRDVSYNGRLKLCHTVDDV